MLFACLTALQAFQVAVLWPHDWLPAPPLNDVAAVQAADGRTRLLQIIVVQSLPFTVGLVGSLAALGGHRPGWLGAWLWVSYGVLFAGELRAWWWPYLVRAEPVRAARYRGLFGATHAFLPERHGLVPNTLHVTLHVATATTLALLAAGALRSASS